MMKSFIKYRLRPFTVMEMIVALGIFSGMLLVLMRFYSSAQSVWTTSEKRTSAYSAARTAFDLLESAYRSSSTEGFEFSSNGKDCTFWGKVPFTFIPDAENKDYINVPPADRLTYAQMKFSVGSDPDSKISSLKVDLFSESNIQGKTIRKSVMLIPGIVEIKFIPRYRRIAYSGGKIQIIYESYSEVINKNSRPDELGVELKVLDERILDHAKVMGKTVDDTFIEENGFVIFRLLSLPVNPLSADKPEGSSGP